MFLRISLCAKKHGLALGAAGHTFLKYTIFWAIRPTDTP